MREGFQNDGIFDWTQLNYSGSSRSMPHGQRLINQDSMADKRRSDHRLAQPRTRDQLREDGTGMASAGDTAHLNADGRRGDRSGTDRVAGNAVNQHNGGHRSKPNFFDKLFGPLCGRKNQVE
mmetsp:Transcript_22583/g.18688  ORF Transcript_22583/g.18688 Transcript_22583/m.18688 type:complete len:122 (+) Transcript_22583:87-452(+)